MPASRPAASANFRKSESRGETVRGHSETAAALDLTEHNVKVRLHRGRAMARGWLFARVGTTAKSAFPFMGVRCDRVVPGVFERLAELSTDHSQIQ
jgi:RNA polymerase sigma-70 factor (ECF subfamily)